MSMTTLSTWTLVNFNRCLISQNLKTVSYVVVLGKSKDVKKQKKKHLQCVIKCQAVITWLKVLLKWMKQHFASRRSVFQTPNFSGGVVLDSTLELRLTTLVTPIYAQALHLYFFLVCSTAKLVKQTLAFQNKVISNRENNLMVRD